MPLLVIIFMTDLISFDLKDNILDEESQFLKKM